MLFRMVNSFARMGAGHTGATGNPMHRARHRSHESAVLSAAFPGNCRGGWNPLKWCASSIPEPRQRLSSRPRFDFPSDQPETFQMTITPAHVPAIVALAAGILILIMPRFLNFIVAIYLIVVGLAGLGVFKMLHF
jgi:hypothetical protein